MSFATVMTVIIGFTPDEAQNLRLYLEKGGFLWADDFWGEYAFQVFENEIHKALPAGTYPIKDLPLTHPIFHTFYDIDRIIQVPNVRLGEMYKLSGGRTPIYERSDDTKPHIRGISDDNQVESCLMAHRHQISTHCRRVLQSHGR